MKCKNVQKTFLGSVIQFGLQKYASPKEEYTKFFAFTCKFGLCLHVQKVVICINKTNWHPLIQSLSLKARQL